MKLLNEQNEKSIDTTKNTSLDDHDAKLAKQDEAALQAIKIFVFGSEKDKSDFLKKYTWRTQLFHDCSKWYCDEPYIGYRTTEEAFLDTLKIIYLCKRGSR